MTEADGQRPVAVITGAARGIGAGIARRFAAERYEVVILEKDILEARRMAEKLGARAIECDVSDVMAVRAAARETGPVSALINNAGVSFAGSILDITDEQIEATIRTNFLGVINCCRAFAPGMAGLGGSIINISSGSVPAAASGYGIYPATKIAIEMLTKLLAQELGPHGIRVNAIGPGAILTERNVERFTGARLRARQARIPLGRTGETSDIADVAAALCSPAMRYVSGQTIYVDGGLSAGSPGI